MKRSRFAGLASQNWAGPGLETFLTALRDDNSHTNDLAHLVHHYTHFPVFIYGTEKLAFSEEEVMHGCKRLGVGFSIADIFHLFITNDYEPVLVSDPAAATSARIKGELYLTSIEKIVELDERHNNGLIFNRRKNMFAWYNPRAIGQDKGKMFMSEAFIYLGIPTYWKPRRDKNGDPAWKIGEMFTPSGGGKSYYSFTDHYDKANRRVM